MVVDILLEIIRALVVLVIFLYLLSATIKNKETRQKGYNRIVFGFGLLLFATIIDITDNFEYLNQYIIIGDTGMEAFLEKIVGYLGGFLLVFIGFIKWISAIKETRFSLEREKTKKEKEIQKSNQELINKSKKLEKLNDVFLGREERIIELKKEIFRLKKNNK